VATFGFTGALSDLDYGRMMALKGPRVAVETPTSWTPTVTGAARTVSIAAGSGYMLGLRHETTGAQTVAQATNATGSPRVDLVVWRADYTAKTVTLTAITGSSSTVAPSITKTALATGVVYDFPICVCITPNGAGAYSAGDIRDIRPYGGLGGLVVPQAEFISAHDLVPGQRWAVEGTSREYVVNSAGALQFTGIQRFAKPTQTGSGALGAAGVATVATVTVSDPGASYRIESWGKIGTTTPAVGVSARLQVTYDSTTWDTNRIGDTAHGIGATAGADTVTELPQVISNSLTGTRTIRLLIQAGANAISVGTVNYDFGVRVVPSVL
jgi:hypothetical protein